MITLIIDASPFHIKVSCIDFEFVATGLRYYYNLQIMCGISFLYSMLISYMIISVFIAFIFLNFESFRKLFLFMKHFSSIHRFNLDIFKFKYSIFSFSFRDYLSFNVFFFAIHVFIFLTFYFFPFISIYLTIVSIITSTFFYIIQPISYIVACFNRAFCY